MRPESNASESACHDLPALLIPAFEPDEGILHLVTDLRSKLPNAPVVVINDGSSKAPPGVFEELEKIPNVLVWHHSINLGKGAALKTGINAALVRFPRITGIITLDADGQHHVEDVVRVHQMLVENPAELILGVRSFDRAVPLRSWFGNRLTNAVFELASGRRLKDTQTGLRGIPRALALKCLKLSASRYEFELDMLLTACQQGTAFRQVPIRTIYIDGNSSSHFNPLLDSLKIYAVLTRFIASSLLVSVLDIALFGILYPATRSVAFSIAAGRVTIGIINFAVNRNFVFRSRRPVAYEAMAYAANVALMGLLSVGFIQGLLALKIPFVAAKIISECSLFSLNFYVQRTAVFSRAEGIFKWSSLKT